MKTLGDAIALRNRPRFERKVRVALDWTLDLLFSKDLVQCPTTRGMPAAVDVNAVAPAASLRAVS